MEISKEKLSQAVESSADENLTIVLPGFNDKNLNEEELEKVVGGFDPSNSDQFMGADDTNVLIP